MRLMRLLKEGDEVKEMWNSAININPDELRNYNDANLRTPYDDEIIYDAESEVEALYVKNFLRRNKISYEQWNTGSRGSHFHVRVRGLDTLSKFDREAYRWIQINKTKYLSHIKERFDKLGKIDLYDKYVSQLQYVNSPDTDDCVRSDIHFIAMENRPHLKTGCYKTLVDTYINEFIYCKLDIELLNIIRNIYIDLTTSNNKRVAVSANSDSELEDIKRKVKVSDLFKKWGYYNNNSNRHNPFWRTSSSKAAVQINDDKHNCFDYNEWKAFGLFTLVQMKHNCDFREAVEKLKDGTY